MLRKIGGVVAGVVAWFLIAGTAIAYCARCGRAIRKPKSR
jgi:hypothetical protein